MTAARNETEDDAEDPVAPDPAHWFAAAGDDPSADAEAAGDVEALAAPDLCDLPAEDRVFAALSEAQLADWIEAIVDHDERALAALYDATVGRVYGLVIRIVRRTAMAEEVVEDAYFQVWRQAVRFDPARGKALTWLLGMARSRAIDALRREARFQHDPIDDDEASEVACEDAAADELLDLARHRADLHEALMLLGPQPRQLVSLAFFRGLSHEEIAERMHLPLGTVKSQIRRALQTMRQALAGVVSPRLAS